MPQVITPPTGSTEFPVNENLAYQAVEAIARQEITNAKSTNRIYDGVYELEVDEGTVIEQVMVGLAEKQAFDRDRVGVQLKDPKTYVRYFNNFEVSQYLTTIRDRDIRAIITGTGPATKESVAGDIIDTLTQADGHDDFVNTRGLILATDAYDYTTELGGAPKTMEGVLFALRDMYNQIRYDNTEYTSTGEVMSTPENDIRIAISDKMMSLIDVVALANIFNMSKADIIGKIVIVPVGDLENSEWWKVIVYDRKRFNRATRLYEYLQMPKQPGLSVTTYLTVERAYFESELFKATQLDCLTAAQAKYNELFQADIPVNSITVTAAGSASSVDIEATLQLSADVSPNNATTKTVTWTSGSTNIATVNESGLVTGVAEGEVVILAKANDDSGVVGTITLNVTAKA